MVFRRSVQAPSGSQKHWEGPREPCRRVNTRALVVLSQLQMFTGVLVACFSVILLLIRDVADGGGATLTNGYLFVAIGVLVGSLFNLYLEVLLVVYSFYTY